MLEWPEHITAQLLILDNIYEFLTFYIIISV